MASRRRRHTVDHPRVTDPELERMRDMGLVLGVIGFSALAFIVGRASAPGADCCERLLNRDMELILCEARVIRDEERR